MEAKGLLLLLLLAGIQSSAAQPSRDVNAPEGSEPKIGMMGWIKLMRNAKKPASTTPTPVAHTSSGSNIAWAVLLSSSVFIVLFIGCVVQYRRLEHKYSEVAEEDGGEAGERAADSDEETEETPRFGCMAALTAILTTLAQSFMPANPGTGSNTAGTEGNDNLNQATMNGHKKPKSEKKKAKVANILANKKTQLKKLHKNMKAAVKKKMPKFKRKK
ncbi:uncharacterized protein LOC116952516 isoform X2 [Petromyzon marinus]|uniref:Uncharacterized protein LOC116952516 n=1 Tax=Petromyzon marinus TaxID=7757 RepID=A0AAJ7XB25_PETMA|nr:uncharacterized protein LOC116952516 [Petromyzon marinus]